MKQLVIKTLPEALKVIKEMKLASTDGHRHTSHLRVKKEKDWKARVKSRGEIREIGRQEAAHLILKVLPKLAQEWKRNLKNFPDGRTAYDYLLP